MGRQTYQTHSQTRTNATRRRRTRLPWWFIGGIGVAGGSG
jgi:type VI protein secretion system component VasF